MKKPFLSLKRARDAFAVAVCIILCVFALSLFEKEEESLPVFANGSKARPKGIYALVEMNFN